MVRPTLDWHKLARLECFAGLRSDQLQQIAEESRTMRLKARSVIQTSEPLFVLTGALRVLQTGKGVKRVVINIIGPGDMLGALPERTVTRVKRQAVINTLVGMISRRKLIAILTGASYQDFLSALQVVNAQSYQLLEHFTGVFGQPLRMRLALELLTLAKKFGVADSRGTLMRLPISHSDLAGLVGCSRRQEITLLHELGEQGMVMRDGRRLIINMESLRKLVNGS